MNGFGIWGKWTSLFLILAIVPFLWAQKVISSKPGETAEEYEMRMKWKEAKFGIFIH